MAATRSANRWRASKKSALHKTISAIRAETWEAANGAPLVNAKQEKIGHSKVVQLDSTVTAALMQEPATRCAHRGRGVPGSALRPFGKSRPAL